MADKDKNVEEIVDETVEEIEEIAENLEEKSPLEQFLHHQRRALEETRKALDTLLPPGFKEHSRKASEEFTQGFRILVDATIDEMKKVSEREDDEAAEPIETVDDSEEESSTGKTKVKIDVD